MTGIDKQARPARILLLEDSTLDAELIIEHLVKLSPAPEISIATRRCEFEKALQAGGFDLILADFSLPDFDGMAALDMARSLLPDVPFIFVSGVLGEEVAIESFRHGAIDYVLKQRLIRLPGAVERALAEARERARRRHAEQQKELLVRELSHRVKNTMAMVLSIVRRTARDDLTIREYADSLAGRLRAIADAHALLFETNWSEAELQDVLSRTLVPYDREGSRVTIETGPRLRLDPKRALAVSMIANELITNAVKYGALSGASGMVTIGWTREAREDGEAEVVLRWRESGGPPVKPPARQGFGTTLIRRSAEYELDGAVDHRYEPAGVCADIRFPLRGNGE